MKGDIRCVDGTLWRHDPQYDDPDLEVALGPCPDCTGKDCESVDRGGRDEKDDVHISVGACGQVLDGFIARNTNGQ